MCFSVLVVDNIPYFLVRLGILINIVSVPIALSFVSCCTAFIILCIVEAVSTICSLSVVFRGLGLLPLSQVHVEDFQQVLCTFTAFLLFLSHHTKVFVKYACGMLIFSPQTLLRKGLKI